MQTNERITSHIPNSESDNPVSVVQNNGDNIPESKSTKCWPLRSKRNKIISLSVLIALLAAIIITIVVLIGSKPNPICEGEGCDICEDKECGDICEGCGINPIIERPGPGIGKGPFRGLIIKYIEDETNIYNVASKSSTIFVVDGNEVSSPDTQENFKYLVYTSEINNATEEEKEYYKYKIKSVITKTNENSLKKSERRNLDETNPDLSQIPFPICVFTHTEENIILSYRCHKQLSESMVLDIKRDFEALRPAVLNLEKEPDKLENGQIKTTKKFEGKCTVNDKVIKLSECKEETQIVLNSDYKLIALDKEYFSNIYQENGDKVQRNVEYKIEQSNEEEQLRKDFMKELYKTMEPYMSEEVKVLDFKAMKENFDKVEEIKKNSGTSRRRLNSVLSINSIGKEINFFNKKFAGKNIKISLADYFGLTEDASTSVGYVRIDTDFNSEKYTEEYDNLKIDSNIRTIFERLIYLSKASNTLAKKLYDKLLPVFYTIQNEMTLKLSSINEKLMYGKTTPIFETSLNLPETKILNHKLIEEVDNALNELNNINNNDRTIFINLKAEINKIIKKFIDDCHAAMDKIFMNLKASTESLDRDTNDKYVIIEKYYLNDTSESIFKRIESGEYILRQYYVEEKNIVLAQLNSIMTKFESQSDEDLNETRSNLDDLIKALENNNITIASATEEEITNTIEKLKNIKDLMKNIISEIKYDIINGIELQNTSYFENKALIDENEQKYGAIIEQAKIVASNLSNTDLPDVVFDRIYNDLRQKFTNILEFIKNKKLEDYPLKENVLKDGYFTDEKKNEIKNSLQSKGNEIINKLIEENNLFTEKQKSIIAQYKINEQNLKNALYDIYDLLSEKGIEKLYSAYNIMLQALYENLNAITDKNFELGKEYLDEIKERASQSIFYTRGFKKKYDLFINSFNDTDSYIRGELNATLMNKYSTMMTNINSLIKQLKDIQNLNELSIYEDLTPLKLLISEFDNLELITNDRLVNHYIQITSNKTSALLTKIDTDVSNLKELHHQIIFENHDEIYEREEDICIDDEYESCYKYSEYWELCTKEHDPKCKLTNKTNNYLELEIPATQNMEKAIKKFDQIYSDFYSKLNKKINFFITSVNYLTEDLLGLTIDTSESYLTPISSEIDSILSQHFDENLVKAAYTYYKNQIDSQFGSEISELYNKFVTVFTELNTSVESNHNYYKIRAIEFEMTALQYYTLYSTNITEDFLNSIVEQNKNEMNYTISFYYGILLAAVKEIYLDIEKNIPVNIYGFTTIHDTRVQQVKNKFNQLINKITLKKNELLSNENQLRILNVKEEDYYGAKEVVSRNREESKEKLPPIILDIKKRVEGSYLIPKEKDKHLIEGRFLVETRNNGKEVNTIYTSVDETNFVDLNINSFKLLVDEFWGLDSEEFAQLINSSINESKKKIQNKFAILLKEEFKNILRKGLYKRYDVLKENALENKISNVFENGIDISKITDETILNFNKNIADLKAGINKFFEEVVDNVKKEDIKYSYDYNKIQEKIDNEKMIVYNALVGSLTEVMDQFKENVVQKVFIEFYSNELSDYYDIIKEIQTVLSKQSPSPYYRSRILNITILSLEATNEIIEEFKLKVRREIENKYQEYIAKLDDKFNFYIILEIFNDVFDEGLEKLLNALDEKASSNGEEYDFTNSQSSDLEKMINETSLKIKLNQIKGNNYNEIQYDTTKKEIEAYYLYVDIFLPLKDVYENFMKEEETSISNEIIEIIKSNAKTTFINFMSRLINYFGMDFIKRMIRYNEIQKIQSLYTNLGYATVQSYLHYENLAKNYIEYKFSLPQNLLPKLIKMNDIWQNIEDKNFNIKRILELSLEIFIDDSGNYIANKFVDDIERKINIDELDITGSGRHRDLSRDLDNLKEEIKEDYTNIMEKEFKTPFSEQYKKTLEEDTQFVLDTLTTKKESFIKETGSSFFKDPINQLSEEINNNLVSIKTALNEYNQIMSSLDLEKGLTEKAKLTPVYEFAHDIIVSINKKYIDILYQSTRDVIYNSVEKGIAELLKKFNKENFVQNVNSIMNYFKTFFDNAIEALNEYGYEFGYEKVLTEEINKLSSSNNRRNLLDTYEDDLMLSSRKRKVADLKLNNILQKLQSMFLSANWIIKDNSQFNEFNENLLSYKSKAESYYLDSVNLIDEKSSTEEIKKKLKEEARYLLNHQNDYYNTAENSYSNLRENLRNNINNIGMAINKCMKETYYVMGSRYDTIERGLNKKHEKKEVVTIEKNLEPYEYFIDRDKYGIDTKFTNIKTNINIDIDVKYQYKDGLKIPTIYASIDNSITPEEIEFKMFKITNLCAREGLKLKLKPSRNNLNLKLSYGAAERDMNLLTNVLFDTYNCTLYNYDVPQSYKEVGIYIVGDWYPYNITTNECVENINTIPINTTTQYRVSEEYNEGQAYEKQ